jgi:hypothetical protein
MAAITLPTAESKVKQRKEHHGQQHQQEQAVTTEMLAEVRTPPTADCKQLRQLGGTKVVFLD